jgi:hypothetical protein
MFFKLNDTQIKQMVKRNQEKIKSNDDDDDGDAAKKDLLTYKKKSVTKNDNTNSKLIGHNTIRPNVVYNAQQRDTKTNFNHHKQLITQNYLPKTQKFVFHQTLDPLRKINNNFNGGSIARRPYMSHMNAPIQEWDFNFGEILRKNSFNFNNPFSKSNHLNYNGLNRTRMKLGHDMFNNKEESQLFNYDFRFPFFPNF